MRRVALAMVAIVLVGGGPSGVAQTSRSLDGGELFRVMTKLERIQPTLEQQRGWATAKRTSFGPFDPARDGLRSVTFIVDQEGVECDNMTGTGRGIGSVILELNRDQAIEFWKVPPPETPASSDRCDFDAAENWLVMNSAGDVTVSQILDQLLIFTVDYQADWTLMHGSSATAHQLVIDARAPAPTVVARLSSYEIDSYCSFAEDRPSTTCAWDPSRSDFVCTETHFEGLAKRYSLLLSGTRLNNASGDPPRTLEQFKGGIGDWAELDDVGAVRLIADMPAGRSGRSIRVFGSAPDLGTPFVVELRDGGKRVTVPVTMRSAEPETPPELRYAVAWPQTIPLNEYRLVGEPPVFRVETVLRDGNVRLLRVVMEQKHTQMRTVYHVAIEDAGGSVIAQAIRVAWDSINSSNGSPEFDINERIDACESQSGGFIFPVRTSSAPLRIDYEVESPFLTGPQEQRRPDVCVTRAHATWQPGKGFAIAFDREACSQTRFRLPQILPDGTITPQVLKVVPQ